MAFAQLTRRRSSRDLVACLDAVPAKLYNAGFTSPISFLTLVRANDRCSWHIYGDLGQRLVTRARPLYADEDLGLNHDDTIYPLDFSTVDRCLSVFGWAPSGPRGLLPRQDSASDEWLRARLRVACGRWRWAQQGVIHPHPVPAAQFRIPVGPLQGQRTDQDLTDQAGEGGEQLIERTA